MEFEDVDALIHFMLEHFPNAELAQDNDGQYIIYTNLTDKDGKIIEFPAE